MSELWMDWEGRAQRKGVMCVCVGGGVCVYVYVCHMFRLQLRSTGAILKASSGTVHINRVKQSVAHMPVILAHGMSRPDGCMRSRSVMDTQ